MILVSIDFIDFYFVLEINNVEKYIIKKGIFSLLCKTDIQIFSKRNLIKFVRAENQIQ